jgi:uncharacterized membrane protein
MIQDQKNKWLLILILVFMGIGLGDTIYLSYITMTDISVVCVPGGSCSQVLTSAYSKIGPLPLALLGAIYYAGLLFFAILLFKNQSKKNLLCLLYLSGFGFIVSLFLTYLQIFTIGQLCFYCLTSAFATTVIFIGILFLSKSNRKVASLDQVKNN